MFFFQKDRSPTDQYRTRNDQGFARDRTILSPAQQRSPDAVLVISADEFGAKDGKQRRLHVELIRLGSGL